jgi:hypothetical protein
VMEVLTVLAVVVAVLVALVIHDYTRRRRG